MNTFISKIKIAALLCGISGFSVLALAGEMKDTGTSGAGQNKIEIKDFAFNPQTITVKSGDKITWINRDEEPHTVVSVGKKFKRSLGSTPIKNSDHRRRARHLEYFCSVHPKMTGTIVVKK